VGLHAAMNVALDHCVRRPYRRTDARHTDSGHERSLSGYAVGCRCGGSAVVWTSGPFVWISGTVFGRKCCKAQRLR
jgi:hypothetical protein